MILNILFGTQTGFSEEVAEVVATYAMACGSSKCSVRSMDSVRVEEWQYLSPLILVCSTTGQGDPPKSMQRSWDTLRMSDCTDLPLLRYAVFGLGDSSYAKYNFMGKMLHNRLRQLGAQPIILRGLGDEQDNGGVWEGLESFVGALFPLLGLSTEVHQGIASSPPILKFRCTLPTDIVPKLSKPVREVNTQLFTVLSNQQLTSKDHFQVINHLVFDRNNASFSCGDSIGIFAPSNSHTAAQIAAHFGFEESSTIIIATASRDTLVDLPDPPFINACISVVDLLKQYFDLDACASRSFLQCLRHFCDDEEERDRLGELISSSNQADYVAYCYREKRSAMEVLTEFPHCKVPFEYFLSHLKPMRPRYYSLSSSPTFDTLVCSITVGQLEISTPYGRKRNGLCSTLLCNAKQGDLIEGFVDTNCPHPSLEDKSQHLILIGPGTGIAPMRSVIREAVARQWVGFIHLFVGCRTY
jgi:NADPH-ferrihemoprotein reductase